MSPLTLAPLSMSRAASCRVCADCLNRNRRSRSAMDSVPLVTEVLSMPSQSPRACVGGDTLGVASSGLRARGPWGRSVAQWRISPSVGPIVERLHRRQTTLVASGQGGRMTEALRPEQVRGAFVAGVERLGVSDTMFANLVESIDLSATRILEARSKLELVLRPNDPPLDVVAFGSMARYEMTQESDFDYLVIAYGLDTTPGAYRRGLEIANELRSSLAAVGGGLNAKSIRGPGASGLFGTMVSAPDLVEVIGLERDTNHSHSRRVLLLEESVSLYDPPQHERLIEAMVARYLEARPPSASGMPRFLLNDLARYWRTLSVDYQAKTLPPARYSLRYFKLLVSRKFTYASALAPLVTGILRPSESIADDLRSAYTRPPILRMTDFAEVLNSEGDAPAVEAAIEALRIVDDFNALLGDADWRAGICAECELDDPRRGPRFSDARSLASSLQDALERIFFSEKLSPIAKKYLAF